MHQLGKWKNLPNENHTIYDRLIWRLFLLAFLNSSNSKIRQIGWTKRSVLSLKSKLLPQLLSSGPVDSPDRRQSGLESRTGCCQRQQFFTFLGTHQSYCGSRFTETGSGSRLFRKPGSRFLKIQYFTINAIFFILRPLGRAFNLQEKPPAPHRDHPALFKTWNF